MFFNDQLIINAKEFIESSIPSGIGKRKPLIMIAYHGDGDGCCAAFFLKRYLEGLGVDQPILFYWIGTPDFDFVKAEKYILAQRPYLTIFLDMPVYNRPQMIEKLCFQGKVFIYDHHYPGICDLPCGESNLLYINPVMDQGGVSIPTTLFAWQLNEHRETIFKKEILFMGLYTETWLHQISIFEEFSPNYKERLKELAKLIHGSFLIQDMNTTHYALDFLLGRNNGILNDQLQNHKEYTTLQNIHDLIQNEKNWLTVELMREIRRLASPKYILKKIESKMRICGLLASDLRWKYPHLVIGIWQRWKDTYYCELRRGKDCGINLVDLINRVKTEVVLRSGGGHPAAAAFTADRENFFMALEKLKHYITKNPFSA